MSFFAVRGSPRAVDQVTAAGGLRVRVAVGAGAFVGMGLQVGVWSVLIADLASALRLSPGTLGAALIVQIVAMIVSVVVGGQVVDRVGRRPVAILGFALGGVAFLLFARVDTVTGLVAVLLIFGAGGSLIDISANAIGADIERQYDTQVMNWLHAGYSIGLALGAGLAVLGIMSGWQYRSVFVALALVLGIFAVALVRLPMPRRMHRGEAPTDPASQIGGGDRRHAWQVITAPAVLLLTCVVFAAYLIESTFNTFLSLYLRSVFSSGAALAGAGVLAVAIAGIAGRLIGGGAVRQLGSRHTFLLAAALVLVGLAAAVATGSGLVTLIGLLLVAFALAPVVPTALSEVARAMPSHAGRAVGTVGAVGYVAIAAGPALTGALADQTSLRFAIGALMLAAAAIAVAGSITIPPRAAVGSTDRALSTSDT